MKRLTIIALIVVLCIVMLAGCRRRDTGTSTTASTTKSTESTTRATTAPATEATTLPHTGETNPQDREEESYTGESHAGETQEDLEGRMGRRIPSR